MIPLRTILLPNLQTLCKYLYTSNIPDYRDVCCDIYTDKLVISHDKFNTNGYMIRIWKSKALFNYWYSDMQWSKFVAALDYTIHPDHIKIEYMNLNDDEYQSIPRIPRDFPGLTKTEAKLINKSLLDYSKQVAKDMGKSKVIVDVHHNLRIFNKYYHKHGFEATTRRCTDNPYWVEVEYILP